MVYYRVGYCKKVSRTLCACSVYPGRTWVSLYILFCASVATGTVLLALIPTPTFLLDVQPGTHRGLPLTAWSALALFFGLVAGVLTDVLGYKRILAFGMILSLFALLAMGGSVTLGSNPAASPVFWVAAVMACGTISGGSVAALASIATFTKHPIGLKFSLALATLASHFGFAVAGLLHAPLIKDNLVQLVMPGSTGMDTLVALLMATAGAGLGLFAVPFVKKNRDLDRFGVGRSALSVFTRRQFWRFVGFAFMWTGAKSVAALWYYALPKYLGVALDFKIDAGYLILFTTACTGLLAPVVQLLLTNANPVVVIGGGAVAMALAPIWLMVSGPSLLGVVAVPVATGFVAIGEAFWWPRFLDYAVVVAGYEHAGAFLGVATATGWAAHIVAASVSPLLLDSYCPNVANCNSLIVWAVPLCIALGQTILAILILRWTGDPDLRREWTRFLKLGEDFKDEENEEEKQGIRIDSSSSNSSISMEEYKETLSRTSSIGVSLQASSDEDNGNPF